MAEHVISSCLEEKKKLRRALRNSRIKPPDLQLQVQGSVSHSLIINLYKKPPGIDKPQSQRVPMGIKGISTAVHALVIQAKVGADVLQFVIVHSFDVYPLHAVKFVVRIWAAKSRQNELRIRGIFRLVMFGVRCYW